MGKIRTVDSKEKAHHAPLYKDLTTQGGNLRTKPRGQQSNGKKKLYNDRTQNEDSDDDFEKENEDTVLDSNASRKILQLAKEQQEELESEENHFQTISKPRFEAIKAESDDSDDEVEYEEMSENEEDYYNEEDEVEEIEADDLEMFEKYFKKSSNPFGTINLADKVMAKIYENKLETAQQSMERPVDKVLLPPRVIEAYQRVGESLAHWRSGKLPKLFKVLPSIKNWEDIIYVTNPESWTPHAVYEATRLFVSNLTAAKAERFVSMVLYPRFRRDIEDSDDHKLNYHLYRALKKSLYKPAAFFKGFLFQLIEDECTVREAVIVGSVIQKCSIPVQHSSVALSWLLEREFHPATTVFIRVLIEKKYALPYQTIDDLVFYFMRFRIITDTSNPHDIIEDDDEDFIEKKKREAPPMPLVWHKAFLTFAQRYKNDITEDQRDFLMETIRQRGHREIGPEIRRELLAGKERPSGKVEEPKDDVMSYF